MTSRGFGTEAAARLLGPRPFQRVAPLKVGIDALERGIARRSRRVVAPRWVAAAAAVPHGRAARWWSRQPAGTWQEALDIARDEHAPLTTPQEPSSGAAE